MPGGRLSFSMSRCVPQSSRGCCRAHSGAPRVPAQQFDFHWTDCTGTVSAETARILDISFSMTSTFCSNLCAGGSLTSALGSTHEAANSILSPFGNGLQTATSGGVPGIQAMRGGFEAPELPAGPHSSRDRNSDQALPMAGISAPCRRITTELGVAVLPEGAARQPTFRTILARQLQPLPLDAKGTSESDVLLFRGLRVRMGMHSGVPDTKDIQHCSENGRTMYTGPSMAMAKASVSKMTRHW
jgi:hypothetical protein